MKENLNDNKMSYFPNFFLSINLKILLISLIFSFAVNIKANIAENPGDIIERINCPTGYEAILYARDLSSPDGLTMDSSGNLYVVEEGAGRVTIVYPDFSKQIIVEGLNSPEGVDIDEQGNLYVVEDVENGRLVKVDVEGNIIVLEENLDAPEGVCYYGNNILFITESNVQFTENPFLFRTRVRKVIEGVGSEIINEVYWFWSYSGITFDNNGYLYVLNEASSVGTFDSVFRINPESWERELIVSGLYSPEGLRFYNGDFPLLVTEEDVGNGAGVVAIVYSDGTFEDYITGFYNIEDVLIDSESNIYVTEDTTGYVIKIIPVNITPTITPTMTVTPTPEITYVPTITATPTGMATLTPTFNLTPTPSNSPSPTLIPTYTLTPKPTLTITPYFSPTPMPTFTPKLTPTFFYTPTITPTAILTMTPTNTPLPPPTSTFTPLPNPSSTPNYFCQVDLYLNDNFFTPEDEFLLKLMVDYNYEPQIGDLYIVLDYHGIYFFFPSWSQDIDYQEIYLKEKHFEETILDFLWPYGAGVDSGIRFYCAILYHSSFDLMSNIDIVEFSFGY